MTLVKVSEREKERERERERSYFIYYSLQEELTNAKISGSVDNPEGMLDALLQVALCEVRQDTT